MIPSKDFDIAVSESGSSVEGDAMVLISLPGELGGVLMIRPTGVFIVLAILTQYSVMVKSFINSHRIETYSLENDGSLSDSSEPLCGPSLAAECNCSKGPHFASFVSCGLIFELQRHTNPLVSNTSSASKSPEVELRSHVIWQN